MPFKDALAFITRTPMFMDTGGQRRPDQSVVAVTNVLNLVVVADLFDVMPVMELALNANQHYLSVFQLTRMRAVNWTNASHITLFISMAQIID